MLFLRKRYFSVPVKFFYRVHLDTCQNKRKFGFPANADVRFFACQNKVKFGFPANADVRFFAFHQFHR